MVFQAAFPMIALLRFNGQPWSIGTVGTSNVITSVAVDWDAATNYNKSDYNLTYTGHFSRVGDVGPVNTGVALTGGTNQLEGFTLRINSN